MDAKVHPGREHMEEAFRRMHKPDWPVHTLDELQRVARLQRLVDGSALRLANGGQIVEADLSDALSAVAPTTAHTTRTPAEMQQQTRGFLRCGSCGGFRRDCSACNGTGRATSTHVPTRRRDDHTVDLKSRAAGEREEG